MLKFWPRGNPARVWEDPVEPDYIPRDQLSEAALTKAQLSEYEVDRVYYDDPHHWVVTVLMFFDPSWGVKHDFTPEMSGETRAALRDPLNERLRGFFVGLFIVVRTLVAILAFSGLATLFLAVINPQQYRGLMWFTILSFFVTGALAELWRRHVVKIAAKFRVILTPLRMIVVIDQLPWRDETYADIPWTKFNNPVTFKTLLGKWLHFVEVLIRSKEQSETIPLLKRMPHGDILKATMIWCTRGGKPRESIPGPSAPEPPRGTEEDATEEPPEDDESEDDESEDDTLETPLPESSQPPKRPHLWVVPRSVDDDPEGDVPTTLLPI